MLIKCVNESFKLAQKPFPLLKRTWQAKVEFYLK